MGLQNFLSPIHFPLVFADRSYGDLPSWHWIPGLGGPGMVLGLFAPKISLLNFYPPHVDMRPGSSVSLSLLPVWVNVVSLIL